MNIIEDDRNEFYDLLHYLTGDYEKKNEGYFFYLNCPEDPRKIVYYDTTDIILIPDPALDANFKAIFLNRSKRFENFLNCIYFNPNDLEISDIEFISGEFTKIGSIYNINNLRANIACKGKIRKKNAEKKDDILLDVEMQINWIEKSDDKSFEYGSVLRNHYSNKIREQHFLEKMEENKKIKDEGNMIKKKKEERVFLDTLVIGLILDDKSMNKSSIIKLIKEKIDGTTIAIDNIKILEINLFSLMKKFMKAKLFGKTISKEGFDWIKFICLRTWEKNTKIQ